MEDIGSAQAGQALTGHDRVRAATAGTFWRDAAAAASLPVFPIRIDWDPVVRKWTKTPLCAHGHHAATTDVDVFGNLWNRASGYGTRMGNGLYGLDLDLDKPGCRAEEWFDRWAVPRATRTTETPSGGLHRIFRVPEGQGELPGRQNIVHGLDGRGSTGWLAFGIGYMLIDDAPPTWLPEGACDNIRAGYSGTAGPVEIPELHPVDQNAVMLRLASFLSAPHAPRSLCRAWGGTRTKGDLSRSGYDHAVACNLALCGFDHSEISYLLLREFPHGVVARDGVTPKTLRAVTRSAATALAYAKSLRTEPHEPGGAEVEEYLKLLREEEGEVDWCAPRARY